MIPQNVGHTRQTSKLEPTLVGAHGALDGAQVSPELTNCVFVLGAETSTISRTAEVARTAWRPPRTAIPLAHQCEHQSHRETARPLGSRVPISADAGER